MLIACCRLAGSGAAVARDVELGGVVGGWRAAGAAAQGHPYAPRLQYLACYDGQGIHFGITLMPARGRRSCCAVSPLLRSFSLGGKGWRGSPDVVQSHGEQGSCVIWRVNQPTLCLLKPDRALRLRRPSGCPPPASSTTATVAAPTRTATTASSKQSARLIRN